jgi:hypothetical protein
MAKSKVPATTREKQSSTSTSTLLSLQSNSEIWYKVRTPLILLTYMLMVVDSHLTL